MCNPIRYDTVNGKIPYLFNPNPYFLSQLFDPTFYIYFILTFLSQIRNPTEKKYSIYCVLKELTLLDIP